MAACTVSSSGASAASSRASVASAVFAAAALLAIWISRPRKLKKRRCGRPLRASPSVLIRFPAGGVAPCATQPPSATSPDQVFSRLIFVLAALLQSFDRCPPLLGHLHSQSTLHVIQLPRILPPPKLHPDLLPARTGNLRFRLRSRERSVI